MRVRFYHRAGDGKSETLAEYDLPAVPARGDAVYLNGASWVVRDRAWDLEGRDETVIVGLMTRDEYRQERQGILEPLRRLRERP